jgi:hypothetical protein
VNYQVGKFYQLSTGEILQFEKVVDGVAFFPIKVGANGKIPEDDWVVHGPIEKAADLLNGLKAKEVTTLFATLPTPSPVPGDLQDL